MPAPYRQTDARAFLLQRYEAIHAGVSAPFAIVASEGGALLGSVALNRPDWQHARAEVGNWLAREARGRGHATRAVRLIAAFAFRTLGLERLGLHAATGNAASQRVAQRAGFTREALLRSYLHGRQGRETIVAFGLLRSDGGSAPHQYAAHDPGPRNSRRRARCAAPGPPPRFERLLMVS